jgi:membrane-associated phospholipid phosphatase
VSDRPLPGVDLALRRLRHWLIALALTALAVAISYAWLDRPIAFFAHAELRRFVLVVNPSKISEWLAPVAAVVGLVLALRALSGRALSRLEAVVLLCMLSLVAAIVIKSQLKIMFGRTWPESWINDNPSLIRDGVYGFNPFRMGSAYQSSPSGHTAAVCAVIAVPWICYPRWRPAYALVVAAVALGLIGADFHFLGDVIAGAFVGASTGWIAVLLWEAGGPRRISEGAQRAPDDG